MKKFLVFIYNPHAGKARIKGKLSDVVEIFAQNGYEVIIKPTRKHGDATEYAREYAAEMNCDRIVCSGGDGTLSEVVTGIVQAGIRIPVGFIPAGTTNDFGYSMKIPGNILNAAFLASNCTPVPSDVGEINGATFIYTAAFGLFSDVSYATPQNVKNILGRMAYILSGASKLYNVKSYHLMLDYDADVQNSEESVHERIEGEFIYGMISNSDSVGGFHGIAGKGVQFDDGIFEMILIRKPHNIIELTDIVNELLNKKLDSENIVYARVSNVNLVSSEELPWSLDGEYGGNMPQAAIHIKKQAVDYIKHV